MGDDYAVKVENLSKRYHIGVKPELISKVDSRFAYWLNTPVRRVRSLLEEKTPIFSNEIFWALKDISFEIQPGEVLGVIGKNGAGKSTLLKILARIAKPTSGYAHIRGQLRALLEVGVGFHPELTGRENIYMSGAIIGMNRHDINYHFNEIVEFSGVEKFIDTPMKHYSSGMRVRLGFAVAAYLDPDVMLIDEVLAVGDLSFQKRSLGKMSDVARQGRTVVYVSHNMESVVSLCDRIIWLHDGEIQANGNPKDVVNQYSSAMLESVSGVNLEDRTDRSGSGEIKITAFRMCDLNGNDMKNPVTGQPVNLVLTYKSTDTRPQNLQAAIIVTDYLQQPKLVLASNMTGDEIVGVADEGELVCHVPRWPLKQGEYTIRLRLYTHGATLDEIDNALYIETAPGDFYGSGGRLWKENTVLIDFEWYHQQNTEPLQYQGK
jgi:lipopolysaccharide transport system ATP-binding protein